MGLSRRQFIQGIMAAGGTATMAGCSSDGTPSSNEARPGSTTAVTSANGSKAKTLVLVNLDGGNDALNTVIPVNDSNYQSLRGSLAIDASETHPLSEGFALHPSLEQCSKLWADGHLAVVHGVGFSDLDRSHFHCRDVWQAGSSADLATGWVGRWLDAVGSSPVDAVAIGQTLPLLARGHNKSAAVVMPGPFALPGTRAVQAAFADMSNTDPDRPALAAAVAASNADLLAAVKVLSPVLNDVGTPSDEESDYGQGAAFAAQLSTVAEMIEANLPTRVFMVRLGGFDTHSAQADTHSGLPETFDAAVGTFLDRVGTSDVAVAGYSEFGRRVAPNASGGTDHGRGGAMILAGAVAAGHHGTPPPLTKLVNGDLDVAVDFRSVLGGLTEGILEMESADLFDPTIKALAVV